MNKRNHKSAGQVQYRELLAGYDLFRHQALLERVRHEPRNRALRAQMHRFRGLAVWHRQRQRLRGVRPRG